MDSVGCYEAKTRLSELIERASEGESIMITKHGHIVAKLVPASGPDEGRRAEAFDTLAGIRRRSRLGLSLKEARSLGRM